MAHTTIRIQLAWWVRWYIAGVALFAQTFGLQPDLEKVRSTIRKGCRPVLVGRHGGGSGG